MISALAVGTLGAVTFLGDSTDASLQTAGSATSESSGGTEEDDGWQGPRNVSDTGGSSGGGSASSSGDSSGSGGSGGSGSGSSDDGAGSGGGHVDDVAGDADTTPDTGGAAGGPAGGDDSSPAVDVLGSETQAPDAGSDTGTDVDTGTSTADADDADVPVGSGGAIGIDPTGTLIDPPTTTTTPSVGAGVGGDGDVGPDSGAGSSFDETDSWKVNANKWRGASTLTVRGIDGKPLDADKAEVQIRETRVSVGDDGVRTLRTKTRWTRLRDGLVEADTKNQNTGANGQDPVAEVRYEVLDVRYHKNAQPTIPWDARTPTVTISAP